MAFYLGKYLIEDQDEIDSEDAGWCFPDRESDPLSQHLKETQNVEELRVLPTDMNLIPTEIQAGGDSWDNVVFVSTGDFYPDDSMATGGWYNVSGVLDLTGFYLDVPPPIGGWYNISAAIDLTGFYLEPVPPTGGWYNISGVIDLTGFYLIDTPDIGGWYNISGVIDLTGFYLLPEDDC